MWFPAGTEMVKSSRRDDLHNTKTQMKLFTIIATAVVLGGSLIATATPASAQYYNGTSTTIGGTTFHNGYGSGGSYSGTSTRIGGTTFHNYSTPSGSYSGTTTRMGGTTFHNGYGF